MSNETNIEVGSMVSWEDEGSLAVGTVAELNKSWATIRKDDSDETVKVRKSKLEVWEDEGEEEEEKSRNMSTTLNAYKPLYQTCVTSRGTKSLHNGDEVAKRLEGMEPEDVMKLAEKVLGLEAGELAAKYEKLNPGQKRMNSGNRIRGALKRGEVTPEEVLEAA